jgi:penicillin-binding protein 1A
VIARRAGYALALAAVAGCGIGAGALAGWLVAEGPPRDLEEYDPPRMTTLLDRHGEPYASLFEERRIVVPIGEMPPILRSAFVAIEDSRFYDHFGIDLWGVLRAATLNVASGSRRQGASTITQQLARNVVSSVGRDRTMTRKLREALVALSIERHYTKAQILETYANQIYLGSGAYGVEAAARNYFGKPVAGLTLAEAATIAGLPQLPERLSPLNDPGRAKARRDQVLGRLLALGLVTEAEYREALRTDVETLGIAALPRARAPYFVDAVRRVVRDIPELEGENIRRAGWSLKTTVDLPMQEAVEAALAAGIEAEETLFFEQRRKRYAAAILEPGYARDPAPGQTRMARVVRLFARSVVVELPGGWRADLPIPEGSAAYFRADSGLQPGDGVDIAVTRVHEGRNLFEGRLLPATRLQGAAVVIDSASGEVRALVGGRDFDDAANRGAFNRAVSARRQAGSTAKPLFFLAALEQGLTPESTVSDSPISFPDGYTPRNYDGEFKGTVTLQRALEQSRNIPTITTTMKVGLQDAIDFVARFDRLPPRWRLEPQWSVVLGALEATPLEMAAAYQPFGAGGEARGPHFVTQLWNEENRPMPLVDSLGDQRLASEQSIAELLQMMSGVMTHGTGRTAAELLDEGLRLATAGKTGTTNDNRDAWFVGLIPGQTVCVWVGFDDPVPLGPDRTGGRAAGPIWAAVANALWELRPPEERVPALPMPEGWHLRFDPDTTRMVAARGEAPPMPPLAAEDPQLVLPASYTPP